MVTQDFLFFPCSIFRSPPSSTRPDLSWFSLFVSCDAGHRGALSTNTSFVTFNSFVSHSICAFCTFPRDGWVLRVGPCLSPPFIHAVAWPPFRHPPQCRHAGACCQNRRNDDPIPFFFGFRSRLVLVSGLFFQRILEFFSPSTRAAVPPLSRCLFMKTARFPPLPLSGLREYRGAPSFKGLHPATSPIILGLPFVPYDQYPDSFPRTKRPTTSFLSPLSSSLHRTDDSGNPSF